MRKSKAEMAITKCLLDAWDKMDFDLIEEVRERMEEIIEDIIFIPSNIAYSSYRRIYNITSRQLREAAEKSGDTIIENIVGDYDYYEEY